MVFFNYATMQMAAKIVYYGPGLCGKTTNLHHIYAKTSPQSRGEMVSLETETDRTLFFDLLPIDVGVIGGFKTRLQLYTIPGQVFYNTTRKLVLKGVDGIVFVADSQKAMIEANLESFKNLRENLAEIGLNVDDIPLVLQLNKRDLPNIATVDELLDALDPERKYEHHEAIAASGTGVFETLKLISKLTLRTLRRRMTGEDPVKPTAPKRGDIGTFRVKEDPHAHSPARTVAGSTPLPPTSAIGTTAGSSPSFTAPAAAASVATAPTVERIAPAPLIDIEEIEEVPATDEIVDDTLNKAAAAVDSRIIADAPVAEATVEAPVEIEPPAAPPVEAAPEPPPPPPPPAAPEPDIDFSQTEKPAKAAPEVKTVKVRTSIDVMAELEALRKRATTSTPAAKPVKKEAPIEIEIPVPPPMPKPKRDMTKSLQLQLAPGILGRAKSVRVTVSFEDESSGVVQSQEQAVELGDTSDVQSLTLNLKIDPA